MRGLAALFFLLPVTAPTFVDPQLAEFRPLIDSLSAVVGAAPDTILLRPTPMYGPPNTTGWYGPQRNQLRVSPDSRDRRRTLIHEYGHVLQSVDGITLFAWVDAENKGQMPNGKDLERFADAFADAFHALSRSDTTHLKPDARFLARILAQRPPFTNPETLSSPRPD